MESAKTVCFSHYRDSFYTLTIVILHNIALKQTCIDEVSIQVDGNKSEKVDKRFRTSVARCGVIKSAWHLALCTTRSGTECQASNKPAERMLIEMPAGAVI